ncbi:histidine kinase [Streptomyces bambusae]|uniref:sensor histidine kinase n=1 Tax=Streptomyces bambusae TaxID=1550616 RepID=UPI001CFFE8C0|nr:histidine kinase [Streptomyces bambusae]MCB5170379.1 histidine kinase [Streptomyces bambusae]
MSRTAPFRRPARSRSGAAEPSGRAPGDGRVRRAAETAGVGLAALGVWAALGYLDLLPHPYVQAAAVVAGAALFPLRRRFPAAVLLVLAALTGPVPCAGPVTAATAYAVARQTAGARRRARLLAAATALVVAGATAAGPGPGPGTVLYGLALGLVLAPLAVVVPGLVGTSYGQQRRLVQALRERGDAAERARRSADSEARTHERSRIAAEMHDLVGHRLSLISLHAGGLEMALADADPELRDEAVLVRRATRDAMRELREALGVLGPLGRDTGSGALTDATGTRPDIEALVAESRAGGIAVRLDWTGPDLDACAPAVRRAVHRLVRESLTNVHRYAPAAHVTVSVTHTADTVRLGIRNGASGTPPAPPGTGRGLPALRERITLLHGTFHATALPTGGFEVTAAIPAVPPAAPRDGAIRPGPADPQQTAGLRPADAAEADGRDDRGAAGGPAGRSAATPAVLGLGLTGLSVLMVLGVAFVFGTAPGETAGPQPLPRVGMTYDQVAAAGVLDNRAVRAAAAGREPRRPAGAAGCLYPFNGATESRPGSLIIARYCFDVAQRLIAIDRFTVPSVRDAAPWETP